MTRQIIELNDPNWHFGQVPRCAFNTSNVDDLSAVAEWLPATVPGNVRTDLLALNRIPDPFFGEGYKESLWVEEVDWWYRRELHLEPLLPPQRAFLIFDGIDYLSAVFINGHEKARHEGMFSRQMIEVTGALQTGELEIAVRVWGSTALPGRQLTLSQRVWQNIAGWLHRSWTGIYPDRSATFKCQMSFGWDFAPSIRTMGIWDDVWLVISGPVFIAAAGALGEPILAGQKTTQHPEIEASTQTDPGVEALAGGVVALLAKASTPNSAIRNPQSAIPTLAPAELTINLTLDVDRPQAVLAEVRVVPANFDGLRLLGPYLFALDLPVGRTTQPLNLQLPEAALWQPWDRGQPCLYDLQIELRGKDGKPLDEVTLRIGIRAVELQDWQFSLNDRSEFIRGLNWVPADSFPGRLRREHYRRLLTLARQSGANLLRVWGGGLREKQAFYDLCDELGLLVWQEFPFACMFLGTYPRDTTFLAQVKAECSDIVRQLQSHPSLVVWCGGNEFSASRNRPLVEALANAVHQHDGTRPFIPVSPSFEHGRDAHNWHVWHGEAPIQTYQTETAHFLSEFGLQALPHLDTLTATLPNTSTGWQTHHADLPKLERYTRLFQNPPSTSPAVSSPAPRLPRSSAPRSPLPAPHSTIRNSQRAQAVALQTAIEHMRRRKGAAGGVCLWQFNEPWPAISWAIVDYFGRPKLAYERQHDWYNPVLISLKFPVGRRWQAGEWFTAEIWAINDSLHSFGNCELQIKLDEVVAHLQTLVIPPDSVQRAGVLAYQLVAPLDQITLTLRHQTEILAQNRYDLAWSDGTRTNLSKRFRRWVAEWVLR